jgi:hypothetical protein
MKTWGSGGIAPPFLTLEPDGVVNFKPQPTLPLGKELLVPTGLNKEKKLLYLDCGCVVRSVLANILDEHVALKMEAADSSKMSVAAIPDHTVS